MPCIVPTCLHTDGTLRSFPSDNTLATRWLEAIQIGSGYSMQVDESEIQPEICSFHFSNADLCSYEEPSVFMHCDETSMQIGSCRICLAFYPIKEMVSLEGTIDEKKITSLLVTLGLSVDENQFLKLLCLPCVAQIEIITFLLSKFTRSEVAFQELLQKCKGTVQYLDIQIEIAKDVDEEAVSESSTQPHLDANQDTSGDECLPTVDQNPITSQSISGPKTTDRPISVKEKMERNCYICNTVHSDANQLMLHLTKNHTAEKGYHCTECSLDFPLLYVYNRHLSRHDESQRPFKCVMCSMRFRSKFWLKLHENKKHSAKHNVQRVVSKSHEIICDQCGKITDNHSLREHIQQVHRKAGQPKCDMCDKTFATKSSLERHMLLHTNAKPYSCDQCEATFRRLLNYRHHKSMVHEGVNPHVCTECNQEFKNYTQLYVHKQKNHSKQNSSKKYYQQYETCKLCRLRFAKGSELKEHIRVEHTNEQYPAFRCPHCSKTFMLSIQFRTHKLLHTDRYICKECGLRHVNQRKLQYHMDLKHSNGRVYTCSECPKTFTSLHQLTLHGILHTKGKQYQCSFCTKSFLRKFQLKIHTRIHTGEKPFQCKGCLKRFGDDRSFCVHKKCCQALLASSITQSERKDK
ncbi:zinc finger protein 431-like isoform X1 [Wyeomyia smithii]|uniref:zinc finger protein 431-like isoform X1 n=1 Tax=Wyeomyia smithii TaxID=174621 RepID=UPI002467ECF1|nr:zinc finger protein 431-like isoform X1 [Wyeomyia smithii]XP_055523699.1 zinc finger protein 431-like isoform X1 [Wyeomyia smithii]